MKKNNVIILLLVCNLAATVWFGVSEPHSVEPVSRHQADPHALPDIINATVRADLFNDIETHFNAKDYASLYQMLGPLAKAQFSEDDVKQQFIKLSDLFGRVQDGVFSHSEFVGQQGSKKVYTLIYGLKMPTSDFSNKGTLKVTVGVDGQSYEIYGIRFNGG